MSKKEKWAPIKGYENLYSVSNKGRVYSFYREKILKPNTQHGYSRVSLHKNKTHKVFKVHRLVALAFIKNPKNKPIVNHKNSVRDDNRVENLEWCTPRENVDHATLKKRWNYGEKAYCSKLTKSQVMYIRENENNISAIKLAKRFKVTKTTIRKIQKGIKWRHLL
jgi:hypothetical protein